MFARFDENPAMTLRVIKETKRYGRTDGRTHGRTDARTDNVKTVYPLQTKFAGGIMRLDLCFISYTTNKMMNSSFEKKGSYKDVYCSPFIILYLGSIRMDNVISKSCYKGTILQAIIGK